MPKQPSKCCEHCGGEIKRGNGGPVTIPLALSNLPTRTVLLHGRCINPFLTRLEREKKPLPQIFPAKVIAPHPNPKD